MNQLFQSTNMTETMCEKIEDETSSVQERAVIMDTQTENLPLTVDVREEPNSAADNKREKKPASSIKHRIRICVLHTQLDYTLSRRLAHSLRENGFFVKLSGDIIHELSLNHPKFAIALQKEIDFIIPVVTEAFKAQIDCCGINEGNSRENEINYFLYDLALKEYSRAYCVNYRVRPVCVSYEIARSVAYDPLLQWCFQVQNELPDLVENLQKTHLYLLNSKSRTKKCRTTVSAFKRNNVDGGENKSDFGKIIIKQQPYVPPNVPQGLDICLNCVAISSHPLHYQWFKNNVILRGETSPMLLLKKLYPDPVTGDKSFQYYCEVTNEYQRESSLVAVVRLAEADESTSYFAEDKVALLIANDKYENLKHLQSPAIDAAELASMLQSMDFKVFLVRNFALKEMKAVIHGFCDMLRANSYAFFYFAGHGFEVWGQTYLLPVDCSKNCVIEECISKEFILEHMQKKRTALNVLLMDTCRRPLPNPGTPSEVVASMKNNTVYGYATTFLSDAYEYRGQNSFFVKHLKKYICQNIGIQEVLLKVARAWASEKSVRNRQNPVLESSLTVLRKLCDPLLNPTAVYCLVPWTARQEETTVELPEIKSTIILQTMGKEDLYFNRIVIHAFLEVKEVSNLLDLEINAEFYPEHLQVSPTEGKHLKPTEIKRNEITALFKKEIVGIQKIKSSYLEGKVQLSSNSRMLKVSEFFIKVEKIKDISIFLNRFENVI